MSLSRRSLGVALVAALAACNDTPTAPTFIHLSVQVQSVGSNDRAMLLELAGTDTSAKINGVVAPPGGVYHVFTQLRSAILWRVIVTGPIANGVVVELEVPKKATADLYRGTILDVADASFAEVTPGARALTVTP